MNILFLTNHLNIGGITSYVFTLSKGLKEKGNKVYLASSQGGELLPRFIEEGIIYVPIPIKTKKELNPKILFCLLKLSGLIKKQKIEIIHSNSRTTQVLGSLLSKFTGAAHVSTCHGFFKHRFLRKIFPCWGKRTIAISQQVKEHLTGDFKVESNNIAVVHNGVDLGKIANCSLPYDDKAKKSKLEFKNKLGLGDSLVVGSIARLSEEKGHSFLIRAMREVVEKLPVARLLIVGEGRMKQGLEGLVRELGLEKTVCFLPSVMDTQPVLAAMDIFVLASLKEGLGLALMEAMAQGLAVIGSGVGGIKSLIQDGSNGLLVPPADQKSLAHAIIELLRDPQKRESLGNNAKSFIKDNFSQANMVLGTEKVYLECVNA